jgi:hypothetical protein
MLKKLILLLALAGSLSATTGCAAISPDFVSFSATTALSSTRYGRVASAVNRVPGLGPVMAVPFFFAFVFDLAALPVTLIVDIVTLVSGPEQAGAEVRDEDRPRHDRPRSAPPRRAPRRKYLSLESPALRGGPVDPRPPPRIRMPTARD